MGERNIIALLPLWYEAERGNGIRLAPVRRAEAAPTKRGWECVRVLGCGREQGFCCPGLANFSQLGNKSLVSRAREERRTAMAPIGYGSRQKDSATTPLFPSGYGRSFVAQPGKVTKLGQQEAIYFVADT